MKLKTEKGNEAYLEVVQEADKYFGELMNIANGTVGPESVALRWGSLQGACA